MGVLNLTPDSFSDGGRHAGAAGIAAGLAMMADGADIIDIGGESTRPRAAPVPPEVEQDRILPAVRALATAGAVISVDTRNASTMAAALDSGAWIVNDISGLMHDPDAAALVAARGCPVVLMHMRGDPQTMGELATYDDVVAEVRAELATRLAAALAAGIVPDRIALDPGIGFAKAGAQNVALLRGLPELRTLGCEIVAGVSRKRFIGQLSGQPDPAARGPGSLAAGLFALAHGARVLRVHDVAATVQAARVWHALAGVVPAAGLAAGGQGSYMPA